MTKRPGPSENTSDIQSVQTDIDAQDAIEATQGADPWGREDVRRPMRGTVEGSAPIITKHTEIQGDRT